MFSTLDVKAHVYFDVGQYGSDRIQEQAAAWIVARAERATREVADYYLWNPGKKTKHNQTRLANRRAPERRSRLTDYERQRRLADGGAASRAAQKRYRDKKRAEKLR